MGQPLHYRDNRNNALSSHNQHTPTHKHGRLFETPGSAEAFPFENNQELNAHQTLWGFQSEGQPHAQFQSDHWILILRTLLLFHNQTDFLPQRWSSNKHLRGNFWVTGRDAIRYPTPEQTELHKTKNTTCSTDWFLSCVCVKLLNFCSIYRMQ